MEKENVIQKIHKLLKLQYGAEKIGNTGEAYQAAKMVKKLLMEYNLSLTDIQDEDNGGSVEITESDAFSYADEYGVVWKRNLLVVICENNLCKVVTTPQLKRMNIVGTEANVIICKEFYQYLVQVFRRLSMKRLNETQNEYMVTGKFMIESMKKDFVRSYLEGAAQGLQENYESQHPTVEETGLVLSHSRLIESWLQQQNIRKGRSRSRTLLRTDGYEMGYEDGKNIGLNKQIRSSNNKKNLLT